MLFSYEAKDSTGRTVTGTVDAQTEREAANQILTQGYFLMKLATATADRSAAQPVKAVQPQAAPYYAAPAAQTAPPSASIPGMGYTPGAQQPAYGNYVPLGDPPKTAGQVFLERVIYPVWSGVSMRDLAVLYRQLSALLNAGVSIPNSLQTLIAQGARGQLRTALERMSRTVISGGQLSDAMTPMPWIFHPSHLAMIKSGELNGGLDIMFRRLADRLEQEDTLRSSVKREMFVPILTLFAFFLLPPLFWVFLGMAKMYVQEAIIPLCQVFGVAGLVYIGTRLLSQVRIITDSIFAILPVTGKVIKMLTMARFSRTLATLYASGIMITTGIAYSADASGNEYYARRIKKALPYIEQGYGLTDALGATRVFPPMVMSMLSTSEQTGSLDILMDKVADFYEAEVAITLHKVSISLGVLATIVMAIKVLLILIKFYTGYFNGLLNMTE